MRKREKGEKGRNRRKKEYGHVRVVKRNVKRNEEERKRRKGRNRRKKQ